MLFQPLGLWRRRTRAGAAALLSLIAAIGCDDPNKPDPVLSARLAVTMPVTVGRPGDRLAVQLAATNGGVAAQYLLPCCSPTFTVVVRDSTGREYPLSPPSVCGCPDFMAPLSPGQRVAETQYFEGFYYDPVGGARVDAPPGDYVFVCKFTVHAVPPAVESYDATQEIAVVWLPATAPLSEVEFVAGLRAAYAARDYDTFASLLHPEYQFRLNVPADDGTQYWGASEELRIHRRMFEPASIVPPETPLPAELWLLSIDVTLTPGSAFDERPEYYRSITNPEGLDAAIWRVTGADFSATAFFETQGDTDYRVVGRAEFVIAADRRMANGAPGKYKLYRWADLGAPAAPAGVELKTWSLVKRLYR